MNSWARRSIGPLFLALFTVGSTALGQTFTISGGVSSGSINITSQYNANTSAVLSGGHSGIQCTLNQDCNIQISTTFAPGFYLESQSQIFLTGWAIGTSTAAGDEIGRIKLRLIQGSYNPSTGAFAWTAAIRVNARTNNTYGVEYSFAIYRGLEATNNWITKNLSKSCSGVGGCSLAATQNTLNVAPAGTTFQGFMMTGFDLQNSLGQSNALQHIAVDGSINAAGTAEGGYTAAQNRKQGMSCSFMDSFGSTVDCTVFTAAFSSAGGNYGYVTTSNQFVHSALFDASSPSYNYYSGEQHSVPSKSSFTGLFTPLKNFQMQYTDPPVAKTQAVGAGCGNVEFITASTPDSGYAMLHAFIYAPTTFYPLDDFSGSVACFANWARIP